MLNGLSSVIGEISQIIVACKKIDKSIDTKLKIEASKLKIWIATVFLLFSIYILYIHTLNEIRAKAFEH